MVEAALMDIFESLRDIMGRDAARVDYAEVLRALVREGLFVEDDLLYDDPTLTVRNASRNHIPESVAAAGVGPAGRVCIAKSLWRKCVPGSLRAIHRRGVRRAAWATQT